MFHTKASGPLRFGGQAEKVDMLCVIASVRFYKTSFQGLLRCGLVPVRRCLVKELQNVRFKLKAVDIQVQILGVLELIIV